MEVRNKESRKCPFYISARRKRPMREQRHQFFASNLHNLLTICILLQCVSFVSPFVVPIQPTLKTHRSNILFKRPHNNKQFRNVNLGHRISKSSSIILNGGEGESANISASTSSSVSSPFSNNPASTTSSPVPGLIGVSSSGGLTPPFSVTLDDATKYSYKDAIIRTIAWVSAALVFGSALWIGVDAKVGEEFFAGYLVEQSLSVDNLFVFLLLFEYFQIPLKYQDRILNWGIYGAIVMRAVMIGVGVTALENFHGILLVFAAILVYGSAKFFIGSDSDEEEDPNNNQIIQFAQKFMKSTKEFDGDRFFTMIDGVRTATPLFVCMIALELSDVVFAIDSIPAVFGVTEDPLIIFSSNIFAIMGLRSLYTILSKAAADLKYLEPAVAIVLGFIGCKMIAEYFGYIVPTNIALAVVATLLGGGIGASVVDKRIQQSPSSSAVPTPLEEAKGNVDSK